MKSGWQAVNELSIATATGRMGRRVATYVASPAAASLCE